MNSHSKRVLQHVALFFIVSAILIAYFADFTVIQFASSFNHGYFHKLCWLGAKLGRAEFWVGGAIIILALSYIGSRKKEGGLWKYAEELKDFALVLLISLAGSAIIVRTLKFIIGRPRPNVVIKTGVSDYMPFSTLPGHDSFPSGHAQVVWAGITALILFTPTRFRPFLIFIGILAGIGRIVLLRHYLSDIVMGGGIAVLWTMWVYEALPNIKVLFERWSLRSTELRPR